MLRGTTALRIQGQEHLDTILGHYFTWFWCVTKKNHHIHSVKHRVIISTLPSFVCSISILTAYKSRKSSHSWLLSCSVGRPEWRALTPAPRKAAPLAGYLTAVAFLNKGSKEANQKVSVTPVTPRKKPLPSKVPSTQTSVLLYLLHWSR